MRPCSFILYILLFSYSIQPCSGQNHIKFEENGLLKYNPSDPLLFTINQTKAKVIIDSIIKLNIPSRHLNGYCEARAHFICSEIAPLLKSQGGGVGKIWAFAPSISSLVSKKSFSTASLLFKGDTINWNYHVAPVMVVETVTGIDTVVIDFSFKKNKYIPYEEWLNSLNCPEAMYTFTTSEMYTFNTLNNLILYGLQLSPKFIKSLGKEPMKNKSFKLQMPENFPMIITGDFSFLFDEQLTYEGLAYNDLAIYLVDEYSDNSEYKEGIKTVVNSQEFLRSLIIDQNHNLPEVVAVKARSYFLKRKNHWKTESYN